MTAPDFRNSNLAHICECGARAANTMDRDSFHGIGTYWRNVTEDGGIITREYGNVEEVARWNMPLEEVYQCWRLNCNLHQGGCGRSLTRDSIEEVLLAWNTRVSYDDVVSKVTYERLKRKMQKRNEIIAALKKRISSLETQAVLGHMTVVDVQKNLERAVQGAFSNMRFLPVSGSLRHDDRVVSISVESAPREPRYPVKTTVQPSHQTGGQCDQDDKS